MATAPRVRIVLIDEEAQQLLEAHGGRDGLIEALLAAQIAYLTMDDPRVDETTIYGLQYPFARWEVSTGPGFVSIALTHPERPTGFAFDPLLQIEPGEETMQRLRDALAPVHPLLANPILHVVAD